MFDGVVTFPSTFFALRSEKVAQKADHVCKLIPCPRELSSSCAVSLAFEAAQVEAIAEVIQQSKVKYEAIYLYTSGNPEEDSDHNKKVVVWPRLDSQQS